MELKKATEESKVNFKKKKKPREKAEEAALRSYRIASPVSQRANTAKGQGDYLPIIHVSSSRFVQRGYDGYSMVISFFPSFKTE